jgi:membrane-associated phospholipid phosphatase
MADSSLRYRPDAPEWADTDNVRSVTRDGHGAAEVEARTGTKTGPEEQPWSRGKAAVLAAIWVAGAVALGALSVAAHTSAEFPADAGIASGIQRAFGGPVGALVELGGNANWPLPAIIAMVVIFATLLVLRLFRAAICTAVAGFGADLLNLTLNTVVARPRPHGIHIPTLGGLGSHSFPSGHVAHTLGLYGVLFYLCWRAERTEQGRRWRGWLIAVQVAAVVFIVTVGPSRILEREHWPSDVLAGYLVGMLTLIAAVALYHVLGLRRARAHPETSAHAG